MDGWLGRWGKLVSEGRQTPTGAYLEPGMVDPNAPGNQLFSHSDSSKRGCHYRGGNRGSGRVSHWLGVTSYAATEWG